MRIKRIEIANFGKFENYSIDFSQGFNFIYGANEDGKSTLMAFIALMFYGTAVDSGRTAVTKNIRKKYAPWDSDKMSGNMEIEKDGKTYRIHKEFKKTVKTDIVSITDVETGERLNLPPEMEIGKYFLGIDYDGFEKSVLSLSAGSFSGTENGDIAKKLSNISESGDESISPTDAISRLSKAEEDLISKRRDKGRLVEVDQRIEDIKERLRGAKQREEEKAGLKKEYEELSKELKELEKRAELGRKAAENQEKAKRVKIIYNYIDILDKADIKSREVAEKLKGQDAQEFLIKSEKLQSDIAIAKEMLEKSEVSSDKTFVSEEDMKKYFSLLEQKKNAEAEELARIKESEHKQAKNKKLFLTLLVLGIALIIGGATGFVFKPILASISVLGILLVVISFIIKGRGKAENREENSKADMISVEIQSLLGSYGCQTYEEFEKAYRDGIALNEKLKIYEDAKDTLKKAEAEFGEFLKMFGLTNIVLGPLFVDEIKRTLKELNTAKENAENYGDLYGISSQDKEELLNLAQDMEKEIPETISEVDLEEISAEIRSLNDKLLEIKGQLGEELEETGVLERELGILLEKSQEMTAYYEALKIAKEVMEEAAEEMRRSFAPKLRDRASEILARLTKGKYDKLSITKTYDIEVKTDEMGAYREWESLSRGTSAQSYLALRIALCELLEDDEVKIPLILDDVLSDYDDIREKEALDFLEEYSNEGRQVLFFTCHNKGHKNKINLLG